MTTTPEWSTACPDWERRIVAGESLIPFDPLFPGEAAAGLEVFNSLQLVDVAGRPLMGEVSRPWASDIVGQVFGSYDADSGRRLISEYFVCVSKKNSKSTLAAGIMLTALTRNWRDSGEFAILSPTIEIANNSFFPARDMVRASEELSDLYLVQDHYRTITHRGTKATLKVVAAENETVGGKKTIGTLIDELWLFGKRPGAENMLREATGGRASRPEGFVIYLTTQSDEPPAGVFKQKLQYARGVRDGRIVDPQFLPVIYEFPEQMIRAKEHREPRNFYITNPNYGASVDQQFIEREFAIAAEAGEESLRGFLAKHLNVEIGLALRSDRWAGVDYWEAAGVERVTLARILEECEVVDIGIDGGGLDDLLGLAVAGRHRTTRKWLAWLHAWAHPSVLERRKSEAARLKDFAQAGDLTIVDRVGDDVRELAEIVGRVNDSGLLDKVGIDPHAVGCILEALTSDPLPGDEPTAEGDDEPTAEREVPEYCAGIDGEKIIGISQGWKLCGAIKTTERKLADGGLIHDGSAMAAWCVSNARIEPRGNAVLITKAASGTGKIDPLMALLNAVSLLSLNPEGRGKSFWE